MPKFEAWAPFWDEWHRIYPTNKARLDACLNFILSIKGVEQIILGVHSTQQLNELLTHSSSRCFETPSDLQGLVMSIFWNLLGGGVCEKVAIVQARMGSKFPGKVLADVCVNQ